MQATEATILLVDVDGATAQALTGVNGHTLRAIRGDDAGHRASDARVDGVVIGPSVADPAGVVRRLRLDHPIFVVVQRDGDGESVLGDVRAALPDARVMCLSPRDPQALADEIRAALVPVSTNDALQTSRLEVAVEAARLGLWEWDIATGRVVLSEVAERLHGVEHGRVSTLDEYEALLHPDDREIVRARAAAVVQAGQEYDAEFRVVTPDGTIRWIESHGRVLHDAAGRAQRVVGVSTDVTARKHAESEREHLLAREQIARAEAEAAVARLRRLQAIADAALGHLSLDELVAEMLERVRQVLVADVAAIALAVDGDDRFELRGAVGLADPPIGYRFVAGQGVMGAAVARREPLLIDDLATSDIESEMAERYGLRSNLVLPLLAAGSVIGVLAVASRRPGHFRDEDLRLLKLVADRVALSVVQTRLFEAEQRARSQAEQDARESSLLHAATGALAAAMTTADVARSIVREGLAAVGACAGAVALLQDGTTELKLAAAAGYSAETIEQFASMQLTANVPVAYAVRTGEPVFLSSREERSARFPGIYDIPTEAVAALPLLVGGRPRAALAVHFDHPRRFNESERSFMAAFAERCQVALERTMLYEAEQRARVAAEEAQRRLEFLSEATQILASSLDFEVSLQSLARVTVPAMADWCVVYIVEDDGQIRRLALEYSEPSQREVAEKIRNAFPIDPRSDEGVPRVIRTGEPILHARVTPAVLSGDVRTPVELQKLIEPLHVRSWMCVPLVARGRTIGAMSFISSRPSREYGEDDLRLAADLARRAGLLVDNARLFREVLRTEERYRALVQTVEAIVWEAEADTLRFSFVSDRAREILGYDPERLAEDGAWLSVVDADDREHVLATYRAAAAGASPGELEYRAHAADGREMWLRDMIYVEHDDHGRPSRLRGLSVDVTKRKEAERRLEAQYDVARLLADAPTVEAAVPRILEAIGTRLDWQFGAMWAVDREARLLRCTHVWRAEGVDAVELEAVSRTAALRPGEGLAGRVWASRGPAWIPDVGADDNFPRAKEAAVAGLRSGFALPIVAGDVIGVMEFLANEVRPPDAALLDTIGAIGGQLGQFIERRRAEEESAFTQALLRSQNEATIDGILIVSPEGRMVSWNERFLEVWGIPESVIRSGEDEQAIGFVVSKLVDPDAFVERIRYLYEHPEVVSREEIELLDGRIIDRWTTTLSTAEGLPLGRAWYFRDITDAKRAEHEIRASEERFAFLAEASTLLASSLDYSTTLRSLAALSVPFLADWCVVDLTEEDASYRRLVVAHPDALKIADVERFETQAYPVDARAERGISAVLRTGAADLQPEASVEWLTTEARASADDLELARTLGFGSYMCVPLLARGRVLGALTFVAADGGRRFDRADLALAEDVAHRVALAVDNARLYHEKSHVARALQDGLLPPELPSIPGIEVAARYRYAGEGTEVGGDFYDIFSTQTDDWALVIGDVCGKGAEAAAVTALARYTIRAVAMHTWKPSRILGVLNEAIVRQRSDNRFCTVSYARLKPRGSGARVTLSSAGHPQPVIVRADGRVEPFGDTGMLLGVFPDPQLRDRTTELRPGDAIIFYTDGVTEARAGDAIFGEDGLYELLRDCSSLSAAEIAERIDLAVFEYQSGDLRDDVALLVVKVPG